MLRSTTTNLSKSTVWKKPIAYSCFKNYYSTTVPDSPATPEEKDKTKQHIPLSQRLGGSGRGRILNDDNANDAFSSFLLQARKPRNNNNNNNRRNGLFTPSGKSQRLAVNDDQFSDAPSDSQSKKTNRARNESTADRKKREVKADGDNRQQRNNNNRRFSQTNDPKSGQQQQRRQQRRNQPSEIRTRRATIFVDKDIDWSSFKAPSLTPSLEHIGKEEDQELILKDMEGDYERYLNVGSNVEWSKGVIQGTTVSHLIGSNPTLDLQQKTAFLAAVSAATNTVASIRK